MEKLKLGLAANKTSYYDPLTNTYITLKKPVVVVQYEDYKVLKNITHALLSSVPALVLYEGKLPEAAIKEWEEKYMKPFRTDMSKLRRALTGDMVPPAVRANRAFDRADRIEKESIDFPEETPNEQPVIEDPATEVPSTDQSENGGDTVVQQSIEAEEIEEIELGKEPENEEKKPKTKTEKGTKRKKSEK